MTTSLTFKDIEAGKSYACKFLVRNGLSSTEYFGVIKTRDCDQELAEIVVVDSGEEFVVKWSDCWAIDEVEWHDPN